VNDEYIDLISAYADDELSEHDRARVEAHLAQCRDCAELLEAYREMSRSVEEASIPVPEHFCESVMARILEPEVMTEPVPPVEDKPVVMCERRERRSIRPLLIAMIPLVLVVGFMSVMVARFVGVDNNTMMPAGVDSAQMAEIAPTTPAPAMLDEPIMQAEMEQRTGGGSQWYGGGMARYDGTLPVPSRPREVWPEYADDAHEYFAVVIIDGDIPRFLEVYRNPYINSCGIMYYIIPREELAQITDGDYDFTIQFHNRDGEYVKVIV